MVLASGVRPQQFPPLRCPFERPDPENPCIGHRPLHAQHRTLFRETLPNRTIYRIALANVYPPATVIFLSLFSNLDDIEVWWDDSEFPLDQPNTTPPATFIPPARKPRGRLILHEFQNFDGWKDLIVSCGGLQFRYIELYKVGSCAPILSEASAETLETFRFYFDRDPVGKPFSVGSRSMDSN